MSPQDLDSIKHEDAMNCWMLYQQGMAGPSSTYISNYTLIAYLHNLTETLISVNSKNYRPKQMREFDEIFPQVYDILTLQNRKTANQLSLAGQAAYALVDSNAPAWLRAKLQEEIDDARSNTTRKD